MAYTGAPDRLRMLARAVEGWSHGDAPCARIIWTNSHAGGDERRRVDGRS
jgi:hypothetical protein